MKKTKWPFQFITDEQGEKVSVIVPIDHLPDLYKIRTNAKNTPDDDKSAKVEQPVWVAWQFERTARGHNYPENSRWHCLISKWPYLPTDNQTAICGTNVPSDLVGISLMRQGFAPENCCSICVRNLQKEKGLGVTEYKPKKRRLST